jgi:DNA processing protein
LEKTSLYYQIALTLIPGIGDVLARNIVSYCGGVEEIFKQKKSHLLRIPGIGEVLADSIVHFDNFKRVEEELKFIESHRVNALFYLDEGYPDRLKNLADSPILLYYTGNANLNEKKVISIVGTRNATGYGKDFVASVLADLHDTHALIVSGLAYGIDICAHKEALKNNMQTIGVLAHGLDNLYPSLHKNTAMKMVEQGGLLTEFMSNTNPDKENFPKRNRIVAGMCDVLLVVETAERGGAMITAEIANSYNKDVMALPGKVNDEFSKGCNKLIKENKASLITSATDLIKLMNWDVHSKPKTKQLPLPVDLTIEDLAVVNYINEKKRVSIDDLAHYLNADSSHLSLQLLDLEFKGVIKSMPGKYFEVN